MLVKSMGGATNFVSSIDDCFRKIWVYSLKHKDDVLAAFKSFHAFVTTQMDKKLKCVRTDNGSEYTNILCSTWNQERAYSSVESI